MGNLKSDRAELSVEERLAKYRWIRKALANHPDFPDAKDHLEALMAATFALESIHGRMEDLQQRLREAAAQLDKFEHRWDDTFVLLGDYLRMRNEAAAQKILIPDIDFKSAGELRKAE